LGLLACPVGAGLFAGVVLPAALARGTPLRDALLFGAGYVGTLWALCAVLATGSRVAGLRSVGRFTGVAAGWGLVIAGAVLALAGD